MKIIKRRLTYRIIKKGLIGSTYNSFEGRVFPIESLQAYLGDLYWIDAN